MTYRRKTEIYVEAWQIPSRTDEIRIPDWVARLLFDDVVYFDDQTLVIRDTDETVSTADWLVKAESNMLTDVLISMPDKDFKAMYEPLPEAAK